MRRAQTIRDDLGEGLQELIDSAEALLEEIKDQKDPAVANVRARLRSTLKSASGRLAALRPDVEEMTSRTIQHTADFVRRDPWRAVALGALAIVALAIIGYAQSDDD